MKPRMLLVAAASALVLVAAFLPTAWYETIPRAPGMQLPFSGVNLLRVTFLAEALILALLAARNVRFRKLALAPGMLVPSRLETPIDIPVASAMGALLLVTAFGLLLRLHGLGQDLWLDEITPIVDYTRLTVAQIIGSYLRSNNHLMNTLLLKLSISMFGESEWSVRLPAVVFGTLTIPALYWVGRVALSRYASLGAAMMLATSYHHVFFSQNARGYTSYLLFALLSTGLFIQAMRDDRLWRWGLYVAAAVLGSASLLITGFVLAGHALLGVAVAVRVKRARERTGPLVRRVFSALGVAGLLAFQIYSIALPEALVVIRTVYAEPATGYPPFSAEFFGEMVRGIVAGFGDPFLALVFLLVGAIGFAALCFFCWPLAAGLALPSVLTATLLGIGWLTFSPRFFLLSLPLAILAAVSAVQAAAHVAARYRMLPSRSVLASAGVVTLLLAYAAGRSLPYYYRTPKQPYRAALRLADSRHGGDRIIVVSNAENGVQYYSRRLPVADMARYSYTRTLAQFDSLTSGSAGAHPQVLTTFPRALRLEVPEIAEALRRDWQADTTLAATVGDGEITVWSRKRVLPVRESR